MRNQGRHRAGGRKQAGVNGGSDLGHTILSIVNHGDNQVIILSAAGFSDVLAGGSHTVYVSGTGNPAYDKTHSVDTDSVTGNQFDIIVAFAGNAVSGAWKKVT